MANYRNIGKRDYLVGKLIDGAKAVEDFFDKVQENDSLDPTYVAEGLASRYHLTENQSKTLRGIASRTRIVKEIVSNVKKNYGLTRRGMIRDKKGLYEAVYGEAPPDDSFSARPLSFSIKFYMPQEYFGEKVLGYAGNGNESLELSELCFRVNYKRSEQLKKEGENVITEEHEIKHIIDGIIGMNKFVNELSADLFAGEYGIELSTSRDMARLENQNDGILAEYKKMEAEEPEHLPVYLECVQPIIDINNRNIKLLDDINIGDIEQIRRKGVDGKTTSYMVSTTELNKLKKRLEIVDDHLEKHPTTSQACK